MIVETTILSDKVTVVATLYNNYNEGEWEWKSPDAATAATISDAAYKAAWITDLDVIYPQYLVQRYAAPKSDFEDEDELERPQYTIRGYEQAKYPLLLEYSPNSSWADS